MLPTPMHTKTAVYFMQIESNKNLDLCKIPNNNILQVFWCLTLCLNPLLDPSYKAVCLVVHASLGNVMYLEDLKASDIKDANEEIPACLCVERLVDPAHQPLEHPLIHGL